MKGALPHGSGEWLVTAAHGRREQSSKDKRPNKVHLNIERHQGLFSLVLIKSCWWIRVDFPVSAASRADDSPSSPQGLGTAWRHTVSFLQLGRGAQPGLPVEDGKSCLVEHTKIGEVWGDVHKEMMGETSRGGGRWMFPCRRLEQVGAERKEKKTSGWKYLRGWILYCSLDQHNPPCLIQIMPQFGSESWPCFLELPRPRSEYGGNLSAFYKRAGANEPEQGFVARRFVFGEAKVTTRKTISQLLKLWRWWTKCIS